MQPENTWLQTPIHAELWPDLQKCVEKRDENFQDFFTAAENESSIHENYENSKNGTLTYI